MRVFGLFSNLDFHKMVNGVCGVAKISIWENYMCMICEEVTFP